MFHWGSTILITGAAAKSNPWGVVSSSWHDLMTKAFTSLQLAELKCAKCAKVFDLWSFADVFVLCQFCVPQMYKQWTKQWTSGLDSAWRIWFIAWGIMESKVPSDWWMYCELWTMWQSISSFQGQWCQLGSPALTGERCSANTVLKSAEWVVSGGIQRRPAL